MNSGKESAKPKAKMWFIGANPWLEYDTPVNAIRKGHFRQLADAATALVDDSCNC